MVADPEPFFEAAYGHDADFWTEPELRLYKTRDNAPAEVGHDVESRPGLDNGRFVSAKLPARKVTRLLVGESLVGEGNEVAHIDLIIGPRGGAAEVAFANALTNNKEGFTSLLALVAPNLAVKPSTVIFNKVTIKGAKQAIQMFGAAQYAIAKAVVDSVADGTIPTDEADDLFICVGVFIHWEAADDRKIQDYNYRATKEAIERALAGRPTASEVVAERDAVKHLFLR